MKKLNVEMLSGFKWTSLYSMVNGVSNGIMLLALGILLTPEELGNRAVVTLLITAAMMLTQFGIAQAIIQRPNVKDKDLNSVFIFNIFLGGLLSFFVYWGASGIASFYSQEGLISLIQLTSLIFIIDSIPLVFKAVLEKNLQFKPLAFMEIIKVLLSTSITITLAYMGFGALSFVVGKLIGSFSTVIYFIIYIVRKNIWKPKLQFSLTSFMSFANFGIFVVGTNILNFSSKNLDEILIGRVLGVELLGIYNLAKQAIDQMTQILATSIKKVTYPTFCKLVIETGNRFSNSYQKLSTVVSSFGFPLFASIALAAPIVIENVLPGSSWYEAITLIQIFCIKSLFDILSSGFASSALYAHDKPRTVFKIELALLPIRVVSIVITAQIGLTAVALGYLAFVILKVLILQLIVNKIIGLSLVSYLKSVQGSAVAIICASLISFSLNQWIDIYYIFQLILMVSLLLIIYVGVIRVISNESFRQMKNVKDILLKRGTP